MVNNLIPNELYIDKAIKILPLLKDAQNNLPTILDNFKQMFFRNSWNDRSIVPRLTEGRFGLLRRGDLGEADKYKNYDYIAVSRKDRDPILYRKMATNASDKFVYEQITKLGNGKFLKEYIESSLDNRSKDGYRSILIKNNLVKLVDGGIPANRDASDVNLKEEIKSKYDTKAEMERMRQEDKDNSKDCN